MFRHHGARVNNRPGQNFGFAADGIDRDLTRLRRNFLHQFSNIRQFNGFLNGLTQRVEGDSADLLHLGPVLCAKPHRTPAEGGDGTAALKAGDPRQPEPPGERGALSSVGREFEPPAPGSISRGRLNSFCGSDTVMDSIG